MNDDVGRDDQFAVAIVGMSGRFPGAPTLDAFWRNLRDGVESICAFSESEVLAAGVPPEVAADLSYVKAKGVLADADMFDASFFGYSPRDAEMMDPQQRIFLEVAWEALETAAYDPSRYPGAIGVFAGCGMNTYLVRNLIANPEYLRAVDDFQLLVGNDKDTLATRVSYKLDLRGPSITVQTSCSSSLTAVSLACQSLLSYQSDLALAGGVAVKFPQQQGSWYRPGGINSPDGHCRPFDKDARGTVGGAGVGIVVLKRLGEATADGDNIRAVIRGSAVNNDGSAKVSFTAPSVAGQAAVVSAAQAIAGVSARQISYVEAHGTGTPLGDPVEVAALTRAFEESTADRAFCALGSVKSNIGHLDSAAGIAGLIKTVLALEHKQVPPTLHFKSPNPELRLSETPFYVADRLLDWPRTAEPRRAAVSSFGIGGTNAHVVLEEKPDTLRSSESTAPQILVVSARSATALDAAAQRLAAHLEENPTTSLADAAYSLQLGRRAFSHRRAIACASIQEAVAKLRMTSTSAIAAASAPIIFLFSGQGAQRAGMGKQLHAAEPQFRAIVDRCAVTLQPALGVDLRDVMFAEPGDERLDQTALTQPALFVFEYALASLLRERGTVPVAMLGHSIGEYVAATLAGLFELDDALSLVALRGRAMQAQPRGRMVAVFCAASELAPRLPPGVSLAADNGLVACTVAGPSGAIAALSAQLDREGVGYRPLRTSHAFHSEMMEPAREELARAVERVERRTPSLPWISNVTGDWITDDEATRADYWAEQLRAPVRFREGLDRVFERYATAVALEVGPGDGLAKIVRQRSEGASVACKVEGEDEVAGAYRALGQLWTFGADVDWRAMHAHSNPRRVALPTYPFERARYWVDPAARDTASKPATAPRVPQLFTPSWRRASVPSASSAPRDVLLVGPDDGLGRAVGDRLRALGCRVLEVARADNLAKVVAELSERLPGTVLHIGPAVGADGTDAAAHALEALALIEALQAAGRSLRVVIVARGLHDVVGDEVLDPQRAAVLGICRVIPHELAWCECRIVEIAEPPDREPDIDTLVAELLVEAGEPLVALRGGHRWLPAYDRWDAPSDPPCYRTNGAYLITGGLGSFGSRLAAHLITSHAARVLLIEAPEQNSESPAARARRERLAALQAAGGRVTLAEVDVADEAGLRSAINAFGPLDGAVHLAGIPESDAICAVYETDRAELQRHLHTKRDGLRALSRALAGRPLDFRVAVSSLTSLIGGFGCAAYAVGCAYMDAFARASRTSGDGAWSSVHWEAWSLDGPPAARAAAHVMTEAEVGALLPLLPALARAPESIVALGDPNARSKLAAQGRSDATVRVHDGAARARRHPRPALPNAYVAPRNEVEQTIADVWQEMLGFEQIGVYDEFFELGAHSLLATQVITRLRNTFQADIPLRAAFESPTIAGLAEVVIEATREIATTDDELARMLQAIEQLTPEEVRRELERAGEHIGDE